MVNFKFEPIVSFGQQSMWGFCSHLDFNLEFGVHHMVFIDQSTKTSGIEQNLGFNIMVF